MKIFSYFTTYSKSFYVGKARVVLRGTMNITLFARLTLLTILLFFFFTFLFKKRSVFYKTNLLNNLSQFLSFFIKFFHDFNSGRCSNSCCSSIHHIHESLCVSYSSRCFNSHIWPNCFSHQSNIFFCCSTC